DADAPAGTTRPGREHGSVGPVVVASARDGAPDDLRGDHDRDVFFQDAARRAPPPAAHHSTRAGRSTVRSVHAHWHGRLSAPRTGGYTANAAHRRAGASCLR